MTETSKPTETKILGFNYEIDAKLFSELAVDITSIMSFTPAHKTLAELVNAELTATSKDKESKHASSKSKSAKPKVEKKSKKQVIIENAKAESEAKAYASGIDRLKGAIATMRGDKARGTQQRIVHYLQAFDSLPHIQTVMLADYVNTLMKDGANVQVDELILDAADRMSELENIMLDKSHADHKVAVNIYGAFKGVLAAAADAIPKYLKREHKDNARYIEARLTRGIGFSPNSMLDLASSRVALYDWQKTLLKSVRESFTAKPDTWLRMAIFVNTSTSSGKTFLSLCMVPELLRQGYRIMYLAPTDMLIFQAMAIVNNLMTKRNKVHAYVGTGSLTPQGEDRNAQPDIILGIPGFVPVKDGVLAVPKTVVKNADGTAPEFGASKPEQLIKMHGKWIIIADEYQTSQAGPTGTAMCAGYNQLLSDMRKIDLSVLVCTANTDNVQVLGESFAEAIGKTLEIDEDIRKVEWCTFIQAPARPVALQHHTLDMVPVSAWNDIALRAVRAASDEKAAQDLLPGLTPFDIYRVGELVAKEFSAVGGRRTAVEAIMGDVESWSSVRGWSHVCLDTLRDYEAGIIERSLKVHHAQFVNVMKGLISTDKKVEPTIACLYNTLTKIAPNGPCIVFTPNPRRIAVGLMEYIKRIMFEAEPYLRDIQDINMEFEAEMNKIVTKDYLKAKGKVARDSVLGEEAKDPGAKFNKIQRSIDDLVVARAGKITDLMKKYPKHESKIFTHEAAKSADAVTSMYTANAAYRMGNFTAVPGSNYRKLLYTDGSDVMSLEDIEAKARETDDPSEHKHDATEVKTTKTASRSARMHAHGFGHVVHMTSLGTLMMLVKYLIQRHLNVIIVDGQRLAVGVNLPIRSVVIYDPDKKFSAGERMQMAGRAGRKGLDCRGDVYST